MTYPDGSVLRYSYQDSDNVHSLTGVEDEAGKIVSYTYDQYGRAKEEYRPGFQNYVKVEYLWEDAPWRVLLKNHAQDTIEEYTIQDSGNERTLTRTGPSCCGGGGISTTYTYDKTKGNLLETGDGNGVKTQYGSFDAWGNATQVTEAVGTTEERVTTYSYDPTLNVLLSKTTPSVLGAGNKETISDYDDDGDSTPNENPTPYLYRLVEKGYTRDLNNNIVLEEYVTTYTYNGNGQVASIDGPRTDVDDVTTYSYYADDPNEGNNRAMPSQVTNALNQTTTYGDYTIFGKPGFIIDPNGLTTRYTYDTRGKVSTVTLEDAGPQGEDVTTT